DHTGNAGAQLGITAEISNRDRQRLEVGPVKRNRNFSTRGGRERRNGADRSEAAKGCASLENGAPPWIDHGPCHARRQQNAAFGNGGAAKHAINAHDVSGVYW